MTKTKSQKQRARKLKPLNSGRSKDQRLQLKTVKFKGANKKKLYRAQQVNVAMGRMQDNLTRKVIRNGAFTQVGPKMGANQSDLNLAIGYCMQLVNPEAYQGYKLPDADFGRSVTYQGIKTLMTEGNANTDTTTANKGRFFYAFKPVLSDSASFNSTYSNWLSVKYEETVTWAVPLSGSSATIQQDNYITTLVPNQSVPRIGLAERARPVGMSVWAEYEGSTLNDAGAICMCVLPEEVWQEHIIKNGTGLGVGGNLMYWENLASRTGNYQGKLKNGAYGYWLPEGAMDTLYKMVDTSYNQGHAMGGADYPIICLAGIIPPAGTSSQPAVLRIRVVYNVEYKTETLVVGSTPSPMSPVTIEIAQHVLAQLPRCMANDSHETFIQRVSRLAMAAAAGFILGGPAGAAMMGISTLLPQMGTTATAIYNKNNR